MFDMKGRTISLGGGIEVPYPEPSSAAASRVGRGNRRSDTGPELRPRSALFRRGLRFRKDLLVRVGAVRVHPDVVFTRARIAIFVDGCFWHSCPQHGSSPKSNSSYWGPKLRSNAERDARVSEALREAEWEVVRVWEHEDPDVAAAKIVEIWSERTP